MNHHLQPMPDDWTRALPLSHTPTTWNTGAASAVARWTAEGRAVSYLIDGEAGIDGLAPAEAAVRRQKELPASMGRDPPLRHATQPQDAFGRLAVRLGH